MARRVIAATVAGLALVLAVVAPVRGAGDFTDVLPGQPYEQAISALASRSAIAGYADGRFNPDDLVTRQQLAKLLVKTLGVAVSREDTSPFLDVPSASPAATDPLYPDKYIAVCYERGWMAGKTATLFVPVGAVTRAELVTIAARAVDLPDPPGSYNASFGFVPDEYSQEIRKAAYAGLLVGLQGLGASYDFSQDASRGESAQVLYNLLRLGQEGSTTTGSEVAANVSTQTSVQVTASPSTSVPVVTSEGAGAAPQGAGSGVPIAYLVLGACGLALVIAVLVLVVVRKRRRSPEASPVSAGWTGQPSADPHALEEVESLLREWGEGEGQPSQMLKLEDGGARADLWGNVRESAGWSPASADRSQRGGGSPGEGSPRGRSLGPDKKT